MSQNRSNFVYLLNFISSSLVISILLTFEKCFYLDHLRLKLTAFAYTFCQESHPGTRGSNLQGHLRVYTSFRRISKAVREFWMPNYVCVWMWDFSWFREETVNTNRKQQYAGATYFLFYQIIIIFYHFIIQKSSCSHVQSNIWILALWQFSRCFWALSPKEGGRKRLQSFLFSADSTPRGPIRAVFYGGSKTVRRTGDAELLQRR